MREAKRQPITRRRPRPFWMCVEGLLRQRVSDTKDNYCGVCTYCITEVGVPLISSANR
jgi:hypothetical protein